VSEVTNGIKALVGTRQKKKFKFMDKDLDIQKLSYAEVMEVKVLAEAAQKAAADNGSNAEAEESGFSLLKLVVRKGVIGGSDLTDEDFSTFPLDELSKLSGEIMKFSGISGEQTSGK